MSRLRLAVFAVLPALLAPAAARPQPAPGGEIAGAPRVISGDRLEVAGRTLRLYGIDAPEAGQTCRLANGKTYDCALVAKTALMDLTAAATVACRVRGRDDAGRALATCRAGGYDLAEGMVHTGWALPRPGIGGVYAAVGGAARKARRGLWRGAFVPPWEWRRGRRLTGRAAR